LLIICPKFESGRLSGKFPAAITFYRIDPYVTNVELVISAIQNAQLAPSRVIVAKVDVEPHSPAGIEDRDQLQVFHDSLEVSFFDGPGSYFYIYNAGVLLG
jgi:hypothetical protein